MHKILPCLFVVSVALRGVCGLTQNTSSELFRQLKALSNTQTVLYVAAHPDDENTRLLTWLAQAKGVRTAYLSLTRGEGGQNLIGREQGKALGILRTQELLSARSVDGAEQYFTTARDFGYSKSPEETFSHWNRDSVLYDIVWVIRLLQPDVVICRFPPTGEGGHGHHTASALLALEAVNMAGDPRRFAEQLRWVRPWHCPHVLWNTFRFGAVNTTDSTQFRLDVGEYLPLLGESVGEIAAVSRSRHRSQAFGTEKKRQPLPEFFKTLSGSEPVKDLLDHVPSGWSRYPGWAFADETLSRVRRNFDFEKPEKSVPELLNLRRDIVAKLRGMDERDVPAVLRFRLEQLEALLLKLCGIHAEVLSPRPVRVINGPATLQLFVVNRSDVPVRIVGIEGWGFSKEYGREMTKGVPFTDTIRYVSRWQEVITQPYAYTEREPVRVYLPRGWDSRGALDELLEKAQWEAYAPVFHLPEYRPESACSVHLDIGGHRIALRLHIQNKTVDPSRGEMYEPLSLAPPLTLFSEKPFLYVPSGHSMQLGLRLRSEGEKLQGVARLRAAGPVFVSPDSVLFSLSAAGDTTVYFTLTGPRGTVDSAFTIYPEARVGDELYRLTGLEVAHEHITRQRVYEVLSVPACVVQFKPLGDKPLCLFVEGAGDQTPEALRQLGFQVLVWRESEPWPGPLGPDRYALVVTGVRALNMRSDLESFRQELTGYVKAGGRVLFQYNTLQDAQRLETWLPGQIRLSRQRITDENAEVFILDSADALLSCPLVLGARDFAGWTQERALYVPESWDAGWKPLMASADKGENQLKGLLLVRRLEKGRMVYTSLALFRQLPQAVPGAVRLFYNMIYPGPCKATASGIQRRRPSSAKEK